MAPLKKQKRSSVDNTTPETIKNGKNNTLAHAINKAPSKVEVWMKMYLVRMDLEGQSMEW